MTNIYPIYLKKINNLMDIPLISLNYKTVIEKKFDCGKVISFNVTGVTL